MSGKLAKIPRTPFALISGSAGWGVPLPEGVKQAGIRVLDRNLAFDTPWGPSGNWQILEMDRSITADGKSRAVLNVFSHGWPLDSIDHSSPRRVAWVLSQSGAEKVLADSTCGSLNKFLLPRDFIIPCDIIDFPRRPTRFRAAASSMSTIAISFSARIWLRPSKRRRGSCGRRRGACLDMGSVLSQLTIGGRDTRAAPKRVPINYSAPTQSTKASGPKPT